jgi:hypothetical protein
MSPTITSEIANDIDQHLRDKFCKVIGVQLSDAARDQVRLPVKSHGFSLGHVQDTISAAYVANVLENKIVVLEQLPSTSYLNHLDDSDATRFGSMDIERHVNVFRTHMQRIKDTASRAGVDIVEKLPGRLAEKKLQILFSKTLTQTQVDQFQQEVDERHPSEQSTNPQQRWILRRCMALSVPKNDKSIIPPEALRKSCLFRLGLPFEELPTHCY